MALPRVSPDRKGRLHRTTLSSMQRAPEGRGSCSCTLRFPRGRLQLPACTAPETPTRGVGLRPGRGAGSRLRSSALVWLGAAVLSVRCCCLPFFFLKENVSCPRSNQTAQVRISLTQELSVTSKCPPPPPGASAASKSFGAHPACRPNPAGCGSDAPEFRLPSGRRTAAEVSHFCKGGA